MKTLLLIFSVFTLHDLVFSEDDPMQISPILGRVFPKKVNSIMHRNLKILNRRYTAVNKADAKSQLLAKNATKKSQALEDYTVFPPHVDESVKKVDIPGSPYFPGPEQTEHKTRVKKVLSDYIWTSRKKRAAALKQYDNKKGNRNKNDEIKKENEPAKKDSNIENKTERKAKMEEKLRKKKELRRETKDSVNENLGKTGSIVQGKIDEKKGIQEVVRRKTKHKSKVIFAGRNGHSKRGKKKHGKRSGNKKNRKGKKHARSGSKSDQKSALKKYPEASRRLIAAQEGLIEDYPYVVSIQKDEEHWCAGALLNPRLVITTANCVWKANHISRMRVRAGSRYADHGGQTAKIQEVLKHPLWSLRKNPDCDIALLLLNKNIRFGHGVHGVDLPNRVMMPIFDDAWITSWGSERRDGIYDKRPMTLQVYHARLMDREKCNNVTKRYGVSVTENFICLTQTGRRAPCTRDTGAPAVSDGVLWGLASWGIRKLCGTERFPAMFSYIGSNQNMNFIVNATVYLMSEERNSPFLAPFFLPNAPETTVASTNPDFEGQYIRDVQGA